MLVRLGEQGFRGRARQPHVGQQDVRLVLLADEVDADQRPHRAVCAVAADHIRRPARCCRPRRSTVTPSASWVRPDHLGAADDLHAERRPRASRAPRSVPLCGTISNIANRVGSSRRSSVAPPRRRDLVHRHAARHQLVGQSARVEQLQGAGVHRECPGDVGHVGALFEQPDVDAAEREFARQHQPGRPGADHDDLGCGHEPDSSPRTASVDCTVTPKPLTG